MWFLADMDEYHGCFRNKKDAVGESQALNDTRKHPHKYCKGFYELGDHWIVSLDYVVANDDFNWILDQSIQEFITSVGLLYLLNEVKFTFKLADPLMWKICVYADRIQGYLVDLQPSS